MNDNERLTMVLFGLLGMLIACVVFAGFVNARAEESTNKHDYVYTVCNNSRLSPTINERECADLQAELDVEFICEQRNDLVTNTCWTEDNDQLEAY